MPKHSGRFKWKKYSKYNGNLRGYWTEAGRPKEHRLIRVRMLFCDETRFIDVFGDLRRGRHAVTYRVPKVDVRVGELWDE